MLTLRCTQKLRKYLGIDPKEELEQTTGVLGDWYGNLIPTFAGDLILFVNERSLLTVGIPKIDSKNLIELFRMRVANLLYMIGISEIKILMEISHFDQIQIGKTANRSVLGVLNDFAWRYQLMAEDANEKEDLSLSKAEFELSQMPCKSIDFRFPSEVAKDLLSVE